MLSGFLIARRRGDRRPAPSGLPVHPQGHPAPHRPHPGGRRRHEVRVALRPAGRSPGRWDAHLPVRREPCDDGAREPHPRPTVHRSAQRPSRVPEAMPAVAPLPAIRERLHVRFAADRGRRHLRAAGGGGAHPHPVHGRVVLDRGREVPALRGRDAGLRRSPERRSGPPRPSHTGDVRRPAPRPVAARNDRGRPNLLALRGPPAHARLSGQRSGPVRPPGVRLHHGPPPAARRHRPVQAVRARQRRAGPLRPGHPARVRGGGRRGLLAEEAGRRELFDWVLRRAEGYAVGGRRLL